jgi:hypothetical protein
LSPTKPVHREILVQETTSFVNQCKSAPPFAKESNPADRITSLSVAVKLIVPGGIFVD